MQAQLYKWPTCIAHHEAKPKVLTILNTDRIG